VPFHLARYRVPICMAVLSGVLVIAGCGSSSKPSSPSKSASNLAAVRHRRRSRRPRRRAASSCRAAVPNRESHPPPPRRSCWRSPNACAHTESAASRIRRRRRPAAPPATAACSDATASSSRSRPRSTSSRPPSGRPRPPATSAVSGKAAEAAGANAARREEHNRVASRKQGGAPAVSCPRAGRCRLSPRPVHLPLVRRCDSSAPSSSATAASGAGARCAGFYVAAPRRGCSRVALKSDACALERELWSVIEGITASAGERGGS